MRYVLTCFLQSASEIDCESDVVKLKPGTYNLVERDLQVLDIVDVLKEMIPELEFIFVKQHLKLRQLLVKPNIELMNRLGIETSRTLKEELEEFKGKFSF